VVYIAVLPFLPAAVALAKCRPLAAIALSVALYVGSQVAPVLNPGDVGFNPFAWQVLLVSGAVMGSRAGSSDPSVDRRGEAGSARTAAFIRSLMIASGVVVFAGFVLTRSYEASTPLGSVTQWLRGSRWLSKTGLGPLRLLHFAAVATLVRGALIRWPSLASSRLMWPFVLSGRHSLVLFCFGVVLAYLAAVASAFLPQGRLTVLFLGVDAVLIQFALAWRLERRHAAAAVG
jgi:hypothetical protein